MTSQQAERYRTAAEDALGQLDWCIGYLHGIRKVQISAQLAKNRVYINSDTCERPKSLSRPKKQAKPEVRAGPERRPTMRYAYKDLGEQPAGTTVIVQWHGSAAEVLLLDHVSFSKYRASRSAVFYSAGGRYSRSPAHLSIPAAGRWYVVADFRGPTTNATVEVRGPDADRAGASDEKPLASVE